MNDEIRTQIIKLAIELFENGHDLRLIQEAVLKLYPEQAVESIEPVVIGAVEMYASLRKAVYEASGVGWDINELCKMTVMDLISHLATNHVKFTFEKPK